ncbi:MAG: AMP-binding protein [Bacteroidetes bacterium]|nr:AMP-binding protein [Bacteroidota bacterium]
MDLKNISFQPVSDIKLIQEHKLKKMLSYLQHFSPFYKKFFEANCVRIDELNSIADLVKIPTISKNDMQQANWDFLCVPKQKVVDYCCTSGTLGNPVTIALTENDLERLALNEYGSFVCAEGKSDDVYQLQLTLDRQFMAGIAYYSGLRKLGAGIIRIGTGNPIMQWENIKKYNPTTLVGVPSLLLQLKEYVLELKTDINTCSVKKLICIGENIRRADFSLNTLGMKIQTGWNVQLFSTYASSEMQTAFTECRAGSGGHLQPELIIVEILDDQGEPLSDGEIGEVTITTLDVEGMPLLRYRTGDLCFKQTEPCVCGRNTMRLSPVLGRKQHMIKLKGTTMYPPALLDLLNGIEEIKEYYVEVSSNEYGLDEVLIFIQPSSTGTELIQKIQSVLQARLRVTPNIRIVSSNEIQSLQIQDGSRKAHFFRDKRVKNSNSSDQPTF